MVNLLLKNAKSIPKSVLELVSHNKASLPNCVNAIPLVEAYGDADVNPKYGYDPISVFPTSEKDPLTLNSSTYLFKLLKKDSLAMFQPPEKPVKLFHLVFGLNLEIPSLLIEACKKYFSLKL